MSNRTASRPRKIFALFTIRELPALAILLVSIVWLSLTRPAFRSIDNLTAVGQDAAFVGILACGEALVILTGGIDLSVAANLAMSGCVAGMMMIAGVAWPLAVVAALAVAGLGGLVNGVLITYRRLPPILVTLATWFIFRSIISIVTHSRNYAPFPNSFANLGGGNLPFVVFVLVVIGLALMTLRTRFGRRVIAIGGSETASELSGLPVDAIKRRVYLIAGLCAGLSALLMMARNNNVESSVASGYELHAIAAVVVGGVRLSGGEGTILGAALGAAIYAVLHDALILYGQRAELYGLITGAIILAAAFGEVLRRRVEESKYKAANIAVTGETASK